jgi:EAL and modified HD-GYP domain-containing signal transduction protein
MDVKAYELRTNFLNDEAGTNTEHIPLDTIYKVFTDSVLDLVVGECSALITLSSEALIQGLWKTIPKSRVMLGYFQAFELSDETPQLLSDIVASGYRLSLSGDLPPECLALLDNSSHTVRLDVTRHNPDELDRRVTELRKYRSKLSAVGVDTHDDLEYCKSLEFDFFQGNFLFRPASQLTDIPVNRINMVRLLSKLHDPMVQIPELEKLISQDLALTYKILQYANSASMALPRRVNSAGHAIRLIGLETIKNWSSALLLSSVDNKPRELITCALIRARMCELLGQSIKAAEPESFHTAGLLSVLDALLDCSMEQALEKLPLADEFKDALIHRSGPIGQALRCTIAYERANWDDVQFYGLSGGQIHEEYMTAIGWARKLTGDLLT